VSGAQRLCRVLYYYYYFINEVVSLARAEPGANAHMVQFTSTSSLRAIQVNEKDPVSLRACGSGVEIQTRNLNLRLSFVRFSVFKVR
jgi:hypothetical protein